MGDETDRVLGLLATGEFDDDESSLVDLKEERGRRDRAGSLLPGEPRNERAAEQVAENAACMANTPGGGALILGADDNGSLTGTALDEEWLRHRAYELSGKTLTLDIRAVQLNGVRLLIIRAPQAIEPIRWRGKIYWRVDDHCVEVDLATWHAKREQRLRFDWSAQSSTLPASSVREQAVDVARKFLRASRETQALDLASAPTPELLRRLNVVTGDGLLTNAGALAFVGRPEPALDYIRRDYPGANSTQRVREGDRGLLEELQDLLTNISASNPVRHLSLASGAAIGQVRDLPAIAVREALVNGVAHRDWHLPGPTVVEHVGATLRVTSPGGFYGGVGPANIITHPSTSRNTALTELLASIRVAEREGIGVDRMVRDMIHYGHESPLIEELAGPYVRTSLVGDIIDMPWIQWLETLEPASAAHDVGLLLLLRILVTSGWFDITSAQPILQLNPAETQGAIRRLSGVSANGHTLLMPVSGIPTDAPPAWTLSKESRERLRQLDTASQWQRKWPSKQAVALNYAAARGRISSTELASLTGSSAPNVGPVLRDLEEQGRLEPSRPNRRGSGFFYRYVPQP
ncbi:MAG: putative DNA binding domain-containing protein [Promicromonosporaceae bacterium]|nr:putative DNA binding domain-containing protein [Promicromonosporaceae bacterium]